jgi:aspartate racemase
VASQTDKTIGVLGGLGPEATLDFCSRVLKNTPASSDQDHFRCIVDNNAKAPNRNDAIAGHGPSPEPSFANSAKMLENSGADFIVMPCNTAHAFDSAIIDAVSIPFVSIIDETCWYIEREFTQVEKVGLLAVDGCLQTQLYQPKLVALGMQVFTLPDEDQEKFMQTIYRIKSQGIEVQSQQQMHAYASQLIEAGAQILIAACTEIPMVLSNDDIPVPLVESTEILAQQTVNYANGSRELVQGLTTF